MEINRSLVLRDYSDIVRLESRYHYFSEFYMPAICNGVLEEDEELACEFVEARKQVEAFFSSTPHAQEVWDMAHRLNVNKRARARNLRRYVERMVDSDKGALLLTLTFRDDLLKLKPLTRRHYLKTWLRTHCKYYVANIDYGGQNGREHYHAVVYGIDEVGLKEWSEKYGFIDARRIGNKDSDKKAVSKYVAKLTNHAIKETTKSSRILYPRGKELPSKTDPHCLDALIEEQKAHDIPF